MFKLPLVLILLIQNFHQLYADVFASVSEMERLVETEEVFIKDFSKYIGDYEAALKYMEWKIEYFQKEHDDMAKDPEKYLSNPLNAFLLIKRMTTDVDSIINSVDLLIQEFRDKVLSYGRTMAVASDDDYQGSIKSLHRLQKTYLLNTTDLAEGVIDGVKYRDKLSVEDCYEISKYLVYDQEPEYAIEWANHALKNHQPNDDMEVQKVEILETLATAYNESGKFDEVAKVLPQILEKKPESEIAAELKQLMESEEFKAKNITGVKKEKPTLENILHSKVCRGEIARNISELSQLYCYYVTNTTAFVKIAPIKAEQVSLNPFAVIFHDIIYDSEIEVIKRLSRNQLLRSMVKGVNNSDIVSQSRLSKIAWLDDKQDPLVQTVTNRVTDMTGLSMKSAEHLQIQNYGIGGHYNCHVDYFGLDKYPRGDRIATTLFYMSTVEKGGATVFPYLKLRVLPVKGTALFWYNLTPSGHGDWRTRHSACPVLVGVKWAANKWIHEHENHFTRPCGMEIVDSPVNYNSIFKELGLK